MVTGLVEGRARALMVLGTGSHVGKSLVTAGLCRIFARRGISVAPFKAQNMSLNSAATPDGLEIGRAQALQAWAAGIAPTADMNPVLLKPMGNMRSQIVVQGRVWGTSGAGEYHRKRVNEVFPAVQESYARLAARHRVVVLEGAGSPAEINLRDSDIVNMRMAEEADARCLLVGDIDRGGVFAAVYGTLALLEQQERARIGGFAINKFRGDPDLLTPGLRMIEERIGARCLGVIPYLPGLALDEEDSLGVPPASKEWGERGRLRIAVIALPSLSNFTDFAALQAEPSVELRFASVPAALEEADVVILPGSKSTAADLAWLHAEKLAEAVLRHAQTRPWVGICGGMQMLGASIEDPLGVEERGSVPGLGLLPLRTEMQRHKETVPATGKLLAAAVFGVPVGGISVAGYEIHVGQTEYLPGAIPFAKLAGPWRLDGCVSPDGRGFGTYLHGVFDDDVFRHTFLCSARAAVGLPPAREFTFWFRQRAASLELLADTLENSLDMTELFRWVGISFAGEEKA